MNWRTKVKMLVFVVGRGGSTAPLLSSSGAPNYLDLCPPSGYYPTKKRKGRLPVKARLFLPFAFFALFAFPIASIKAATVVTFDDLSETASGSFLANGYQGLDWNNFGVLNAVLFSNTFGLNGAYYGMVSASNVAINAAANPAEIDSVGAAFNFLSSYLTGYSFSNLNIQVQGFSGTTMLYNTTVVASATSPTLFTFNYLNIDRLTFASFGGQDAGFVLGGNFGPHENFIMDNFTFEFVPEPSTFLLTGAGVLTLCAFRKRKRA
ncbi:MAG: PEP-CTERM sorting domain-containing protein [Verrucomicrobiia bacterium]|jgi:hypothetical protein